MSCEKGTGLKTGSLCALSSSYALKSQQKQISALNKEQFVLQLSSSRGESSSLDPAKAVQEYERASFPTGVSSPAHSLPMLFLAQVHNIPRGFIGHAIIVIRIC